MVGKKIPTMNALSFGGIRTEKNGDGYYKKYSTTDIKSPVSSYYSRIFWDYFPKYV